MHKSRKNRSFQYISLHIALLTAALVCLLLLHVGERFGISLPCVTKRLFGLSCPLCGGTHAVRHLLALRILPALRANTAVVLALPLLLAADLRALVLLIRRDTGRPLLPRYFIAALLGLFLTFFLIRNLPFLSHLF